MIKISKATLGLIGPLSARRFLTSEHTLIQSDTGLQHFKFCYNLGRSKILALAQQVFTLPERQRTKTKLLHTRPLLLHCRHPQRWLLTEQLPKCILRLLFKKAFEEFGLFIGALEGLQNQTLRHHNMLLFNCFFIPFSLKSNLSSLNAILTIHSLINNVPC